MIKVREKLKKNYSGKKAMKKKLGFALGSGGSRGTAHIGFLKAMEEEGIKPDFISGSSMGSVVGSCYASGLTPDYMAEVVKNLKKRDLLDLSFNPLMNGALLKSEKIKEQLKTYLGDNTFASLNIPFTCVATDFVSGKTVVLGTNEDDDLIDSVTASSSIPSIFKPVEKGEMRLVDGGLLCRVPVEQVFDMGAEVVVAVDVLGSIRKGHKRYNLLGTMFRMFDICDSEMTRLKGAKKKAHVFIEPDLGEMLQYQFKGIPEAIESGYKAGKLHAEQIKALIGK